MESKISAFITRCFKEYSLNISEYLPDNIDGYNLNNILVNPDTANRYLLYLSEVLGMSVEDIEERSAEALFRWIKKYFYVWSIHDYNFAYKQTHYENMYGWDKRSRFDIFDAIEKTNYDTRFDFEDIALRVGNELQKINGFTANKISVVNIETRNFCDFGDIEELVESFISMINCAITLLLKGLTTELSTDEINEYNFLVSILGLRDKYCSEGYLRYSDLYKVKELYAEASFENIYDFISFEKALDFQPWLCRQFISNKPLVEKYLSVLPFAKSKMRKDAMDSSQILCEFIWQDENQLNSDNNLIYVEKTPEELMDDEKYASQLLEYCRPASLGGISIKTVSYSAKKDNEHNAVLSKQLATNSFLSRLTFSHDNCVGGSTND